jgi:hypothetical protein
LLENWSSLPWVAVPSVTLGAALAWCNIAGEERTFGSTLLRIIGYVEFAPIAMILLGLLLQADTALQPARPSLATSVATWTVLFLGFAQIVALACICRLAFANPSLSTMRKALSVILAVAFVPLTFLTMLMAGEALAGVSM